MVKNTTWNGEQNGRAAGVLQREQAPVHLQCPLSQFSQYFIPSFLTNQVEVIKHWLQDGSESATKLTAHHIITWAEGYNAVADGKHSVPRGNQQTTVWTLFSTCP